jgi:hypothetical protein
MDLNSNETFCGQSLELKQDVFVADFSTIVLGIRTPGHSFTEWTFEWQNGLFKPMTPIKSSISTALNHAGPMG